MKDIQKHLLPFQNYAKILLRKIHPDAHHGYPMVQKVNASIICLINELFKFHNDIKEESNNFHNLRFFVHSPDKFKHKEIFYELLINIPFDQASGKSALGLFKTADIPVDFTVIDSLPIDKKISPKIGKGVDSSALSAAIKQRCLDLSNDNLLLDLDNARSFLHFRPYIQFEGPLPEDKSRVLKLVTYLSHILHRNEHLNTLEMPIILISDRFSCPEKVHKIIHLPLSSNFEGTPSRI